MIILMRLFLRYRTSPSLVSLGRACHDEAEGVVGIRDTTAKNYIDALTYPLQKRAKFHKKPIIFPQSYPQLFF